jgi:dephospho-CoA kinase
LREGFGEAALADVIANDAKNATADLVVIDGVRREQDISLLRELPNFKFVYIEATPENRYARLSKRGENADDNTKTWEQFLADHELETEKTIPPLKNLANVVIGNDGSMEELNSQLDRLVLGVS